MREKSIDGKWINNAIGFCHYETHPGALNMELARKRIWMLPCSIITSLNMTTCKRNSQKSYKRH